MEYINKFNTTDEFTSAKPELSNLKHYMVYDAEVKKMHLKPLPNYFIVNANTGRYGNDSLLKLRVEGGGDGSNVSLKNGDNKIEDAKYGFSTTYSSNSDKINSFDFTYYITNEIVNMSQMFYYCESITSLNLSKFNTSNVTNMANMFSNCKALTSLDLSSFDTSKVTIMTGMFNNCSALSSLNLSNFDTSKVVSMSNMFNNCNFESINLSKFNTSNVTNINNMFQQCYNLTSLDLSNFDTSKVTDMGGLFSSCHAITYLNLRNFDATNVTNKMDLFFNLGSLNKITCKQAFKDWCLTNQTIIRLPDAMKNGGSGTWDIVS